MVIGVIGLGGVSTSIEAKGLRALAGAYPIVEEEIKEGYTLQATAQGRNKVSAQGVDKLGDIIIEEKVPGTFITDTEITLVLPSERGIEFKVPSVDEFGHTTAVIGEETGTFSGQDIKIKVGYDYEEKNTLLLKVDNIKPGNITGGIKIKGLEVQPVNKDNNIDTGNIVVKVKSSQLDITKLALAIVRGRGISAIPKEEISLIADKEEQLVQVTLSENAPGSLKNFLT